MHNDSVFCFLQITTWALYVCQWRRNVSVIKPDAAILFALAFKPIGKGKRLFFRQTFED